MSKTSPCPRCRERGNDRAGDNLVHFLDGGAHCFSCSFHIHPTGMGLTGKSDEPKNKAVLPYDFTREVPTAALKWLLQYGLPWSYWKDQIGYSPSEERLVFLVGEGPVFSIGRYVGTKQGKDAPRKWYVWGDSHKHCEVIRPRYCEVVRPSVDSPTLALPSGRDQRTVVLVEDLVSAHKVVVAMQNTATPVVAIPLFGTVIHKPHLYYLMQEKFGSIMLWLDKDQQGVVMKKAMGLQALVGVPVGIVSTEQDPKEISLDKIEGLLR